MKDAFIFCHILYIRVARRYNYSSNEHRKHYNGYKVFFLESLSVRSLEGLNGAFVKIR